MEKTLSGIKSTRVSPGIYSVKCSNNEVFTVYKPLGETLWWVTRDQMDGYVQDYAVSKSEALRIIEQWNDDI